MITSKKSLETFLCGHKVLLYLQSRSCAASKLFTCNNHACSIAFGLGVVLQLHFVNQRNTSKWLNFTSLNWISATSFLMLSKNSACYLGLLLSHSLSVTCPKVKKAECNTSFFGFRTPPFPSHHYCRDQSHCFFTVLTSISWVHASSTHKNLYVVWRALSSSLKLGTFTLLRKTSLHFAFKLT